MYIVFYKRRNCENSRRFVNILSQANLPNTAFIHVDRERDGSRTHADMIHKFQITRVPTVIAENNTKYSGTAAFQWLQHKLNSATPTDTRQSRNINPRDLKNNNSGGGNSGHGKPKVIQGVSDSGYDSYVGIGAKEDSYMNEYSSVDSNQIIYSPKEDDYNDNMRQGVNFEYNADSIGTFEMNDNRPKKSNKTSDDEMRRRMEQYNKQRESDDKLLQERCSNPYQPNQSY